MTNIFPFKMKVSPQEVFLYIVSSIQWSASIFKSFVLFFLILYSVPLPLF